MKKYLIVLVLILPLLSVFFVPNVVSAVGGVRDIDRNTHNTTTCQDNNNFKSYITPGKCLATYQDWLNEVWGWAMRIMIPLSVLIFTGAGVIYMTSEGDSNRIGIAKKMIIGVLSGVGLLVLGRVLLVLILGDTGANLWTF